MRRRIILVTVAVAIVGVFVLGLPLAYVGARLVHQRAKDRLDQEAETLGARLEPPTPNGALDLTEVADYLRQRGEARYVVVRDRLGAVLAKEGTKPKHAMSVTLTIVGGATVTVSRSATQVREREALAASLVALLGLAGIATAGALAVAISGRLTRPLRDLADASDRLGTGDFSVSLEPTGLPEVDAVADALSASAQRIAALVRAEREFSANASHQLRTPLTALRMRLEEIAYTDRIEDAHAEVDAALAQADRLELTIDDLLALARTGRVGPVGTIDVAELVRRRTDAWRADLEGAGRRLDVTVDGPEPARVSQGGLTQALDVLVDNAKRHGAGTVTIEVFRSTGRVEVRVSDEGAGVPSGMEKAIFDRHVSAAGGTGVGLHLARTLVEADGGRLELTRARPAQFAVFLPR